MARYDYLIVGAGLFGAKDVGGVILVDPVTGEMEQYALEDVPQWVDRVYDGDLLCQQYDDYGKLKNGLWNSLFAKVGCVVTTADYGYKALEDDLWVFTGVTSVASDESNIGFILSNQRTKQTKFYSAPGATEDAAKLSAMGVVQDLGYTATFPLLLNIADQPTYFIPLKDATNLVKSYAMVNVAQYQVVAVGSTVAACEQSYIALLSEKGITTTEELPRTEVSGRITDIRSAVMDGNSYFIQLRGDAVYYSLSAAANPIAVILNVGDTVTISHAPALEGESSSILTGETVTLDRAAP